MLLLLFFLHQIQLVVGCLSGLDVNLGAGFSEVVGG